MHGNYKTHFQHDTNICKKKKKTLTQ